MTRELTERQRQCLVLMAEGLNRKEIASALGVKLKTVDYHFDGDCRSDGIHRKLRMNNVALLTQWALKHGGARWVIT